jgi:hypothetical protein
MEPYSQKELEEAQTSLHQGTSQWTTLSRRMKAFSLAYQIVSEKLDELKKGKE